MQTRTSSAAAVMAAGLMTLTAATAQAQSTSFQVEHFEPLPSQGTNTLNVGKSDVVPHLSPSVGLFAHYVNDPLVIVDPDSQEVLSRPLAHQLKTELWGSVGLFDIGELGFVLPVVAWQRGDALEAFGRSGAVDGFGFADARIIPKLRLMNPEDFGGFGLALMAPVYLPIGDEQSFNSAGGLRVEPRLIADWRHDSGFAIAANVGYQTRPETVTRNLVIDDVMRTSLAAEVPVGLESVKLIGTVFGNVQLEGDRDEPGAGVNRSSPFEALGGLQLALPADLVANVGAGSGLNRGIGSPDFRVFASIGYTPRNRDTDGDGLLDREDTCPEQPEDPDGFEDQDGCPDLDNDGDEVPDAQDACPMEPEDQDGFEDQDGCPDPDNDGDDILDTEDECPDTAGIPAEQGCPTKDQDGDGVLDAKDQCPNQPEDEDGWLDEDGCPDLDNDGDGIPDAEDECPDEPELVNGIDDDDGCPEPDSDGDGIIDQKDKCPQEAETYNGNKDDDGCPDGKQTVVITETELKILEKVFFDTGKATIKKRSHPLLDTVATVLKQNPQVTQLRVEGHTDDVGDAADNLELSQARAQSVEDYLVEQGVGTDRLISKGFGEGRPLCKKMEELRENRRRNRSKIKACRAENRRVQFKILAINGERIEATESVKVKQKEVIEEPLEGEDAPE